MNKVIRRIRTVTILALAIVITVSGLYSNFSPVAAQGTTMNPSTMFGRAPFRGYATNYYTGNSGGYSGRPVFSSGSSVSNGVEGMPVYNTNAFLARLDGFLWGSPSSQDAISAAFVINIMMDIPGTRFSNTDQSIAYAKSIENDWGAYVRYLDPCTLWGVTTGPLATYQVGVPNSHYATDNAGGASQPNDNAFYGNYSVQTKPTIVFRDPADGCSTVLGRIKMNCGNPMGRWTKAREQGWQYYVSASNNGANRPNQVVTITGTMGNSSGTNAGAAARDHNVQIRPDTNTGLVSFVGNESTNSGGTNNGNARWTNFGPIINGTSGRFSADWRISSTAPNGATICFKVIGSPKAGNGASVTDWGGDPPAAASTTLSARTCITVSNPPPPPQWRYDARTEAGTTPAGNVTPGQTITFVSDVYNSGNGAGPAYTHTIYRSQGSTSVSPATNSTWTGNSIPATTATADRSRSWTVNNDAADGTRICASARVSPVAGITGGATTNPNTDWATERCWTVDNKRFNLDATVVIKPSVAVPGQEVNAGVKVCNSGSIPGGSSRGNAPNVGISVTGDLGPINTVTTQTIGDSTSSCWSRGFDSSGEPDISFTIPITANLGDTFCTYVSTNKDSGKSNVASSHTGSTTAEDCVKIAIAPYLGVAEGDVWAGANFDASATPTPPPVGATCPGAGVYGDHDNDTSTDEIPYPGITSVTFQDPVSSLWRGSLVEYAAFAMGDISGFGSNNSASGTSLTFATTPSLGNYTQQSKCIPNYYGLLSNNDGNTVVSPGSLAASSVSNRGQYFIDGNVSATTGFNSFNTQATVVVNGSITITENIVSNSSYGTTDNLNIPALVFVADGDIRINPGVTQVDAILISHEELWTCNVTELASGVCDERLVINGAIIANRIQFMRTHEGGGNYGGVHDSRSLSAEQINFAPSFYLSKPVFQSNLIDEEAFTTVLSKDLPPIY